MEALPATLQAVQQQLDVQGAALQQVMEKLCAVSVNSSSNGAAVVLRDKHTIFDSLYRRIETFNYDPDRGRTFDSCLRRYQDLFDNECNELDEKDKTKLLFSRLDEDCHRMLTSAISPKQPSDSPWEVVVQVLNRLFGTAKTLFRRRFECFKVRYEGQDFNKYETMVKTKCTDAHFDSIDFDGLQCLFYVAGFHGTEFADYRTRLLRKLDQAEKITLKDLTAECQLIRSYKDDARLLEGTPAVNVVRHQKFQLGKKRKPQRRQRNESSSKAIPHRPRKSTFKPRAPSSNNRYSRNRHIHRIVAALQRDDHPQVEVTINGRPLQLLLDTGAEITLISEFNWNILGKPTLQQKHLTAYAANGTPLKIHGCFDTDFTISCSSGTQCNDMDQTITGPLLAVRKYQICSSVVVDHLAGFRDITVAKLKTDFADVFSSGLGKCTTAKATLLLKPNSQPIFKRKRPVPYATVAALDNEIDRLLAEGVISPVTYSIWAAPIVVVKKSNETIRLCADYSTGLNEALMLHQYPLPTPEDVFTKLNGGTVFTQIDLADAYLQVEVDDATKEL